jgi:dTDP-glucose pyrophosphorylase/CBS domain-containing protein
MIVDKTIRALALHSGASLQQAMEVLDRTARGVVLAVDDDFRLLSTITDGDLRRGLLAGLTLSDPLSEILRRKTGSEYSTPTTVRESTPPDEILRILNQRGVRHMPVVDEEGHVVDLVTADQLVPREMVTQAVIMAGGYGKRLLPLTESTPKPMLPVGDQPLMELMIGQLREAGIRRVNVTTHFEPEKIRDHFGDGARFGVEMNYVLEERPLGTAGALRLIEQGGEPILIINGDILTKVDVRAMLHFHNDHKADLTVGVREYDFQVPYGVVETQDTKVVRVNEKPVYRFFVNAGIYLLQPALQEFIPSAECFNMTDLIEQLVAAGRSVVSFPIMEYWLDIGRLADYERAQQDVKSGEFDRS